MATRLNNIAFDATNMTASSASHSRAAFSATTSKHRLNIRRRAGDDAQDLARRRLLLQRLFEFLEQPHIFDGDHGLIGEGFEKFDLRRGEGAHLVRRAFSVPINSPLLTKGND